MSCTPRPSRNAFLFARLALALGFAAAFALPAGAEWGDDEDDEDSDGAYHSLDSVDTGRTHSLDSEDTGRSHSLDSVDTGRTHSADSVDTGRTHSLDSEDTGRSHSLDSVDTGRTESLDSVDQRAFEPTPAAPAPQPLPPIQVGNWEGQAQAAKRIISTAEARSKAADAAYSNMLARDYPRGEARAAIIDERQAAEAGLNEAWSYFGEIKKRAREAGQPL